MTATISSQAKDYFEFVKAIGESKSKQEEDRIISEEVVFLKKAFSQSGLTKKKMKELVVRSLYVEMLGQDASFAYIRAVELCASSAITQKKVGYLAASLCLSPAHEFRFMLVNQIQRDMKSANMLEVCAALNAVCKIVTDDMIPAVITDVITLLKHDMEFVRKKAVSALHRFYQLDRSVLGDHLDKLRRTLCDKDPSVMGATLPLFHSAIIDDVTQFKDLVPSFVSILKQIIEHRLPRDFDYHRIPSPWIQMALLRILALLGKGDQQSSEGMYEVLVDCMKRADTGINVGYAIVYECVKTITTIYPNTMLMDAAATSISRFIRSDSHNLKYVGIRGLTAIVKDHPRYAADHQMAVIDCLEDPDETLKRKTLDLLFRMTNALNVEFIVEKLLSFLHNAVDDHFRSDLVHQITQCAERYAPSNTWYVQTIIQVFELAGDKVKAAVAQTLIQLIAEGAELEDEDEDVSEAKDNELRTEAVEHFLALLDKPKLPFVLARTMAWVLGEYGYLSTSCSKEEIMNKLCDLASQCLDPETKSSCITALGKLVAQSGTCPSHVLQTIQFYSQSKHLDLQQRCLELLSLLKLTDLMAEVLPVDASCEDIEIEENLAFLDDFVQVSLNMGARPYDPPQDFLLMLQDDGSDRKPHLKITPYDAPRLPAPTNNVVVSLPETNSSNSLATSFSGAATTNFLSSVTAVGPVAHGNQLLNTRSANQVWGRKSEPPPSSPPPVPVVTSVTVGDLSVTETLPEIDENPKTVASIQESVSIPEPPKVLSEKEKMAKALFGGFATSSTTVSSSATAKRKASTSKSTISTQVPPQLSSSEEKQFLPPPSILGSPNELLDFMDSSNPDKLSPDKVLSQDLLAGLTLASATPAPVPQLLEPNAYVSHPPAIPPQPVSSLISDVFGQVDLTSQLNPSSFPSRNVNVIPLVINTSEFGRRWTTTAVEMKRSVSLQNYIDPDLIRKLMPANYHHVESIPVTHESIYAATETAIGAVILVHAKFIASKRVVEITVKSSSQQICEQEIAAICLSITK